MRNLAVLFIFCGLLLAGCDSISERVRDRFTPVPPQTRTFAADRNTVSAAVREAFRQMDFNVTSGGSGATHFEASSSAHPSSAFGDTRQIVAEVELTEAGPGQTDVALHLTEEVESYSSGGRSGAEQALRDHPLYARFFANLQQVLTAQETPAAAQSK